MVRCRSRAVKRRGSVNRRRRRCARRSRPVCATRNGDPGPAREQAREDDLWMRRALELARRAAASGEVPVGAVVVDAAGSAVGEGWNLRETRQDPTAHAEVVALVAAARRLGSWRLIGCTLYVTLEPCAMCAGALVNARVQRLVYGAEDPKAGFCGSLGDIVRDPRLNHRMSCTSGVRAAECSRLLVDFFRRRRPPVGTEFA
ncbi:MAG: tRNA adenosine(34) deaminase TadA [Acidobacteria bacterium]|nr:MAG: tRNA adenosine(34) deaminase TadA [Acidobacteriota bacterium]